MKLSLDASGRPAIAISCFELARVPFGTDEAVFSETFVCDDIAVTLSCAIPEVEEQDGLCVLSVPKCADVLARRDLAGAMAYVFCTSQGLERVGLRLSDEHVQTVGCQEAYAAVLSATRSLFHILHVSADDIRLRAEALSALRFPYASLRAGQKTLMQQVYGALRDGRCLFAHAPTGIGKTLSVLYPALKALGRGRITKVFYLTPRGSLMPQIAESILALQGQEAYLHSITLSAKGNVCPHQTRCIHTDCECKKSFREKEARALRTLFETYGHIDSATVRTVAEQYGICPFELSLSASMYCDVVVCDYNYIFDPHASLKRFRGKQERFAILCDEAHNLVARVRESFSAELNGRLLEPLLTPLFSPFPELQAAAKRLTLTLFEGRPNPTQAYDPISFQSSEPLAEQVEELSNLLFPITAKRSSNAFPAPLITTAKDVFYALQSYLEAHEDFDCHRALCTYPDGGVKLLLVDPSEKVSQIAHDFGSCIFFSATLSPESYYLGMLGGTQEDFLGLPSPFDPANLKIITCPISTLYHDRARTADLAALLIARACAPRVGNYMVFFPSFEYMNRVVEVYRKLCPRDLILCQSPQMNERARADYIAAFSVKRAVRLLGFAVLGGLFSEGVDLVGDKLLGEVIFGVGMPPPSPEAEAVRRRFDDRDEDGTALGYTFPGFNRVLQSAGRVIRTDTDRGFLLLCDERYLSEGFSALFPDWWQTPQVLENPDEISRVLADFWADGDEPLS